MCLYVQERQGTGNDFQYTYVSGSPGFSNDQYEWVGIVNNAQINQTNTSGTVCPFSTSPAWTSSRTPGPKLQLVQPLEVISAIRATPQVCRCPTLPTSRYRPTRVSRRSSCTNLIRRIIREGCGCRCGGSTGLGRDRDFSKPPCAGLAVPWRRDYGRVRRESADVDVFSEPSANGGSQYPSWSQQVSTTQPSCNQ